MSMDRFEMDARTAMQMMSGESVCLDKLMFAAGSEIGGAQFSRMSAIEKRAAVVDCVKSMVHDAWEFRLSWLELGKKEEISFSYPKTWWDAVKDRWFPAWALRRWPAEMETRTLRIQVILDQLPTGFLERHGARVEFYEHASDWKKGIEYD